MDCPHCKVELKLAERKNIEIDYCPQCRGVWLDRGELDKLIESSALQPPVENPRARSERHDDDRYEREHRSHDYKKYKRKSLLSEIFDF